ncbi:MAG: adenylate/guanylate cyclase domain-containing protein [Treponema sp.]|nr:adenylate/guanylate cyclase domain-containing protein [Treponema sp.]
MQEKKKVSKFYNAVVRRLAEKERGFTCAALSEIFALIYHICVLIFFCAFGIKPMFYFNLFSVTCFCINLLILFAFKKVGLVFFITVFEVLVHQICADYFLGAGTGFHFLIMILVVFPFLVEKRGFNVGIPTSFVSLCVFFGCEFIFSKTEPVYNLDENIIRILRIVNVSASMSVLFVLIVIFKLIIDYIENGMEELNMKNEALLENILPKKVVENLRTKGKSEPELFSGVTVLFTDVVNFTSISKTLQPDVLIRELNDIFTNFDRIMDEHDCVRIKTIGDAYMAVCGLPERNDRHAENIIAAALDCRNYLKERNKTADLKWTIRLGAHTGTVVAGIVGVKKYIYDVFGDTVNVASRMESSSEEMKLCVSEALYKKAEGSFNFECRGEQQIKGKGLMKLYFAENS